MTKGKDKADHGIITIIQSDSSIQRSPKAGIAAATRQHTQAAILKAVGQTILDMGQGAA